MTTLRIWYCRGCRMAIKTDPATAKRACRCQVPVLPRRPTTVHTGAAP